MAGAVAMAGRCCKVNDREIVNAALVFKSLACQPASKRKAKIHWRDQPDGRDCQCHDCH